MNTFTRWQLTALCWLGLGTAAFTQPILSPAATAPLPLGDTLIAYTTELATNPPGPGFGANSSWDFSAIAVDSTEPTRTWYEAVSNQPFAERFPTATTVGRLNTQIEVFGTVLNLIVYFYEAHTSAGSFSLGEAVVTQGALSNDTSLNVFAPSAPTYLALNYLDQRTDSSFAYSYAPIDSAATVRFDTLLSRFVYDSYGTLTLPGGRTFTDVALLRQREIRNNFSDPAVRDTVEVLQWVHGPDSLLLATAEVDGGSLPSTAWSLTVYDTVKAAPVGLQEFAPQANRFLAYPNPAAQTLHLELPTTQPAVLSWLGPDGQEVRTLQLPAQPSPHTISAGDLPNGLYVLRVQQCGQSWAQRVLVQH